MDALVAEGKQTDVVVVGAGPVGLACALEIQRAGHQCVVVEKGALVNSLIGYPTNMEFFSTPDLLEIGGYPLASSRYKPVREETIDYYRRVAREEKLDMLLFERVLAIEGEAGRFNVSTSKRTIEAAAVVIATGFFDQPNMLGVPGEDLSHVSHYFREAFEYASRKVCIIGAKNSAAIAALQCHRRGARVTMVVRSEDIAPTVKYWIRPDLMNRIAEGSIAVHFQSTVKRISEDSIEIQTPEGIKTMDNDVVLALTGYHPDYSFLQSIGLSIGNDPAETPVYDETTFETSRKGIYLAGTVCGGRHTSRWFIENGRFHAQQIAQALSAAQ